MLVNVIYIKIRIITDRIFIKMFMQKSSHLTPVSPLLVLSNEHSQCIAAAWTSLVCSANGKSIHSGLVM